MPLFLSLSIASEAAKQSFSKLEIIKSYLGSSMPQQTLNGLSILSIKHNKVSKTDFNILEDKFVGAKVQNKDLKLN